MCCIMANINAQPLLIIGHYIKTIKLRNKETVHRRQMYEIDFSNHMLSIHDPTGQNEEHSATKV